MEVYKEQLVPRTKSQCLCRPAIPGARCLAFGPFRRLLEVTG